MRRCPPIWMFLAIVSACLLFVPLKGIAQQTPSRETAEEPAAQTSSPASAAPAVEPSSVPPAGEAAPALPAPDANGLIRLSKTDEVWIDSKRKRVIVGGQICLDRGMLEMFACPQGTKEHESIVSVRSQAYLVHAALLAVGAKVGRPVQYEPEYRPAEGTIVDITVAWKDEQGKVQSRAAQEMIRHVKTGKQMQYSWVFAGSGFWQDPETGKRYYMAEGGELICLSNFTTAMLDLPVESSQDNTDLLYEAFPGRIPPLGTEVKLVLTPRREDAPKAATTGEATTGEKEQPQE